ncbi:hypothetical protein [Nitrosopumilus sp.]|uniref:hypothetical protein n=1 Tax=Nitrosopumilus sp. TaxID=2024843 RepID=UPI0034A0836A
MQENIIACPPPTLEKLVQSGFCEVLQRADEDTIFIQDTRLYRSQMKINSFLVLQKIYDVIKDVIPKDKEIICPSLDAAGNALLFLRHMGVKNKMTGYSKHPNLIKLAKLYGSNIEFTHADGYKTNLYGKVVYLGFRSIQSTKEQMESLILQEPHMIINPSTITALVKNDILGVATKMYYYKHRKRKNFLPELLKKHCWQYTVTDLKCSYITPFFPVHVLIAKPNTS